MSINQDLLKLATQERSDGLDLPDSQMQAVISEYIQTISLPSKKYSEQFILCPVGRVGAGKTTVVKLISERLNLLRISTDEIRQLLLKKGCNFLRTSEIGYLLADKYLSLGYSLAIDADCAGPSVQNHLRSAASKFNAQLIWIHINPPEEFIINKLNNFKHSWLFRDSEDAIENYYRRKPLHDAYLTEIDFYFEFDTSKEDLSEQITSFVKKFESDFN